MAGFLDGRHQTVSVEERAHDVADGAFIAASAREGLEIKPRFAGEERKLFPKLVERKTESLNFSALSNQDA